MNNVLRLAAASLNQTALDWSGNLERIKQAYKSAKRSGADLLCCPELAISGYGCEDAFLHQETINNSLTKLLELAKIVDGTALIVGCAITFQDRLYNCAAVLHQKKIIAIIPKQNLAANDVYYEYRWFKAWPAKKISKIVINRREIPFGDIVFALNNVICGIEICEDAWVKDRPLNSFKKRGVQLIFNLSASHFEIGKKNQRHKLIQQSLEQGISYLYANLLGCESGRLIYDGGLMIACASQYKSKDSDAELESYLTQSKRFSFRDSSLILRDLRFTRHKQNKTDLNLKTKLVKKVKLKPILNESWESSAVIAYEEFARAVALGLFDYMRKSFSKGFLLSLSGGADSATVLILIRIMINLALKELGLQGIKDRLAYFKDLTDISNDFALMQSLVNTVYLSTVNNSSATRIAAKELAEYLGAQHFELSIDALVNGYISQVQEVSSARLNWQDHDIALQNIQARTRAPAVWLLANLKGALLLTTSNRSEAAVGYATMDGDTCGGLAPIAGVDKYFIQTWLKQIESDGLECIQAIDLLESINSFAATAELRPGFNQTDEEDLMPYKVLAMIERLYLKDRLPEDQLQRSLVKAFSRDYSKQQLKDWLNKFFKLWKCSQWKRERIAPAFHIADFSLDPKTWMRFPILNA